MESYLPHDLETNSVVCIYTDPCGSTGRVFLSVENLDADHGINTGLWTRGNCDFWEKFAIVINRKDKTVALRNMRGGYLSVSKSAGKTSGDGGASAVEFKFRPHASSWEFFELVHHPEDPLWLTDCVAIRLAAPAELRGMFVAPGAQIDMPCTLSAQPHYWRLRLAEVPVIDAEPAVGRGGELIRSAPSAESLPPAQLHFVYKLLRAHVEVGACQVVMHGIVRDLFSYLNMVLGGLAYEQPAPVTAAAAVAAAAPASDEVHKINYELMVEHHGEVRNRAASLPHASARAAQLASDYFAALESFSDTYLHALALGQQLAQQQPAAWRHRFHHDRYLGLRVLQYKPGDAGVLVTRPHTDATWITVLDQDSAGGLYLRPTSLHVDSHEATESTLDLRTPIQRFAVQPFPGALLCNAGNVLEAESRSFYRSGCHWVERIAAAADRTRFSMPFFFDRNGGRTGGCTAV